MRVFTNGLWVGFNEKTDGMNFALFEYILHEIFEEPIELWRDALTADLLLESHFGDSMFFKKTWRISIFFSGEGLRQLPSHAEKYTFVMGARKTTTNFVSLPLYLLYDFSRPTVYPNRITEVPKKNVCAIVSSDHFNKGPIRVRTTIIDELCKKGLQIDMAGTYKNNVGYKIPGTYWDSPIIDFQKQYRVVLALENIQMDDYITEKIVNPLRAGTVPLYYGSKRINEYINQKRFLQIDPNNIDKCIAEINRLCTDDAYWLEIVNQPIFIKSIEERVKLVIDECKIILSDKAYHVEIIANIEKEQERAEDINAITNYFNISPSCECYGIETKSHPLYSRFDSKKNIAGISLAINHIAILKKYVNKDKYLVVFESDAIPIFSFDFINNAIQENIEDMKKNDVDITFIGLGVFAALTEHDTQNYKKISDTLWSVDRSRCTESYIISPKGLQSYLEWFYSKYEHTVIDWDYNHFFSNTKNSIGCWRSPELFKQGSCTGKYKTLVGP